MEKVNAWWHGLKEWQRVVIAVVLIPVSPLLAGLALLVIFGWIFYWTNRDILNRVLGGGE